MGAAHFSAPTISTILVVEAATPEGGRRRYAATAIPVLIASAAGFAVYFIGGAAGLAVHLLIPGIPEGLSVIALFAAVPGAGASIPLTLTFLAAMTLTIASPVEAAPAAIAAAISYALFTGFLAPKPQPARPADSN